jgi:hypothetical protein
MDFKKYLPIALVVLGLLVLVAVYFLVIKGGTDEVAEDDESALVEVSLADSPVASLTPTADGHWLNMVVTKLNPMVEMHNAATMDYELLYKLPDGRTQGVPGTIKLTGQESIENDLLLGSESSGKFRYDEGVEQGTFTLRFLEYPRCLQGLLKAGRMGYLAQLRMRCQVLSVLSRVQFSGGTVMIGKS